MGLDSYLTMSIYVNPYSTNSVYDNQSNDNSSIHERLLDLSGIPDLKDYCFAGISIEYTIGYWRKAWGIHNWFVSNVQDGIDNCTQYYVDVSTLRDLKSDCERAIAEAGITSTFPLLEDNPDEWDIQQIKNTIDIASFAIKLYENNQSQDYPKSLSFYYNSSW